MKSLFTKASLKSNLRHVYIGIAFVYTAAETYLAKGNTIGFNKETFIGVGAQVGIALSALAMKYVDKSDPVMGKAADAALKAVDAKLEPMTEPKPTSDGVPVQVAPVAPVTDTPQIAPVSPVEPSTPVVDPITPVIDTTPGAQA